MTIQQTSIMAYIELKPKLGEKQTIIYKTIQKYPDVSDHEIERITNLRISTITARRNELETMGLIQNHGTKKDRKTGKTVMKWITTNQRGCTVS